MVDHRDKDFVSAGFRWYSARPAYTIVNLQELWGARELIWMLALRDLKVRYRQTSIGVLWAILQSLLPLIVFSTMFGLLGQQGGRAGPPYPLATLCGLVLWQVFNNGVTSSSTILVDNRQMVTKVYFPRLALPISAMFCCLIDFLCAASLILVLSAYYSIPLTTAIFAAPLYFGIALSATFACGVWLSALNALYRDIGYTVPFLLQLLFFLSPVVYQTDRLVPERWRLIYAINPLVGAIEGFRWAVTGEGAFPWVATGLAILSTGCLLVLGLMNFHRIDRFLADRI